MSQTTLNLSSDQIFVVDCICLLQHSILCYFERSWEHHQGWPWACVIFWLLASDLRSQAKKIVRIPSAHVGWSGHEKSIKSRVLIEILTTNDRVRVQLICYVMAPNWLPVSHWPFVRYLTQSLDQSDKSTSDNRSLLPDFKNPPAFHPRSNIKYQQPHCYYLLPNLEILMFLILTN